MPWLMARAAAMSSWVDSGLDAASETVAPPACSSRTSMAVSAVMCRQAAMPVTVGLRLVRAVHRYADVVRLLLGQLAEPDAERVQVQPGHLLVQVLGQRVHAGRVLVGLGEQL